MSPLKPYLIRALYDWIVDNQCSPYLVVDATQNHVMVPAQFIEDGRIVLNLRPQAVQGLSLGNHEIEFNARFGGSPMHVSVPMPAVIALYAYENGRGMVFEDEGGEAPPPEPPTVEETGQSTPKRSRPALKIVK